MTSCRDWQKTIFKASFKGVPFEVESDSVRGGRRIATHEYPSREDWDNEDLGKSRQIVDVTGYVHGDTADEMATRLFDACCSPGAGSLVLPTYPSRQARCVNVERSFTADALGVIEVRMTFTLESGARGGLANFAFLLGAVTSTVGAALRTVQSVFEQTYNALNVPNVAREAATETVRNAAVMLANAASKVPLDAVKGPLVLHNITTLARDARTISLGGEGEDVIRATAFSSTALRRSNVLGKRLSEALVGLVDASTDVTQAASALEPLTEFEPQVIYNPINCESVKAERRLTDQVARYVRVLATIKWAEAKALSRYSRKQDAVHARAEIVEKMTREIDVALAEPELDALLAVRNAAIEYLTKNGAELPVTRKVTLQYPNPMLVIAHEVYGDPSRDEEMIERNGVEHALSSPYEFEITFR